MTRLWSCLLSARFQADAFFKLLPADIFDDVQKT